MFTVSPWGWINCTHCPNPMTDLAKGGYEPVVFLVIRHTVPQHPHQPRWNMFGHLLWNLSTNLWISATEHVLLDLVWNRFFSDSSSWRIRDVEFRTNFPCPNGTPHFCNINQANFISMLTKAKLVLERIFRFAIRIGHISNYIKVKCSIIMQWYNMTPRLLTIVDGLVIYTDCGTF